jgi:hypothetical protein
MTECQEVLGAGTGFWIALRAKEVLLPILRRPSTLWYSDMLHSLAELQAATRDAVIDGPGAADPAMRRRVAAGEPPSELALLVQKVRDRAYEVTDEEIDALRAKYNDDQLFEMIVAAAIGAAEYRLKAAMAAIDRA